MTDRPIPTRRRPIARPMARPTARLLAGALALAATLGPLVRPAPAATAAEVKASIAKGVAYLYSKQKADAEQWEEVPARPVPVTDRHTPTGGQWGGFTSLATYTLLAAGENPQDPRLQKAVRFLAGADIVGTYALGMRAQVWTFLPPSDDQRTAALRDFKRLAVGVEQNPTAKDFGLYDYVNEDRDRNRVDLSVSQYGVLGMWASAQTVEVPGAYWAAVEKAWLKWQQPSGGWAYAGEPNDKKPVSGSMTAAGVATLFLTQEFLRGDEGVACRGNARTPNIDAGVAYLADVLPQLLAGKEVTATPLYYTLYGIERIGVASGLKYLKGVDWYGRGADFLVKRQQSNGSFGSLTDTCFSLLFLARGGEPVMVNKLQYSVVDRRGNPAEGDWNQRPRDAANVTRYVSKQIERGLNWQSIDLDAAGPLDLHDAPIAYLAGDQALELSDEAKAKLKDYALRGGLIVANADCARRTFATAFQKLGHELFPAYEFRKLPDGSPILTNQQFNAGTWRRKPDVLALGNGVREFMLLIPDDDAGRAWQKGDLSNEPLFQLMANVYLYATDKQKASLKGDTHVVLGDDKATTTKTVEVARIKYDGNWDPEPAGWDRLAAVLRNGRKVELKAAPVELKDLASAKPRVAHLTGTGRFEPGEDGRKAIKDYVEAGGTLVVDAAGGSSEFASSVEQALADALGPDAAKGLSDPLPSTDKAYQLDGKPPGKVDYRDYARAKIVGSLDGPRIRAITVNGRAAVFYSPDDLSTGLVGQPVDGVVGYAPATATDLMTRLVLNAAGK